MDKRVTEPCNKSVGTCIVFNCQNFKENGKIVDEYERKGTKYDVEAIKETFLKFRYDILILNDPTKKDIEEEMKHISSGKIFPYIELEKKMFFICFILSHGHHPEQIQTSDTSIDVKYAVIEELQKVPALKGKNKILVLQACRGGMTDEGETEGEQILPKTEESGYQQVSPITSHPHFFVIFASSPGYVSYRYEKKGTTFIHMFCGMLKKYRSELSLSELVQRLIFTISCLPICEEMENGQDKLGFQIPNFHSTLQSLVFLHHEKKVKDKRSKNYAIKDVPVNKKIQEIIGILHTKAKEAISNSSEWPVLEDSDVLLMAKQTTGSYDIQLENDACHCLVIDIRRKQLTNTQAKLDYEVIKETMKQSKFNEHVIHVTNETLFTCVPNTTKKKLNVQECLQLKRSICYFLCFIQLDKGQETTDSEDIKEIICQLKCQTILLGKPKVFIFQPYKNHNGAVTDGSGGKRSPNAHTVKISRESDLLIIFSNAAAAGKKTLTNMFCKTLTEDKGESSIVDLLEYKLPKQWETQWEDINPSFSSTLRKHLVLKEFKSNNIQRNTRDKKLLGRLKTLKEKIETVHPASDRNSVVADFVKQTENSALQSIEQSVFIRDSPNLGEPATVNGQPVSIGRSFQLISPNIAQETAVSPTVIISRQYDEKSEWKSITMVWGYLMLAIGVLILILSSTKLGLDNVGHQKHHLCDINHNQPLNESLMCEHESGHQITLAIDVSNFITNSLIAIVGLVVLINVKRNRIFKENRLYYVCGALCFAFSMLSCILEIVRINVATSNSYYFKGKYALSVCIIMYYGVLCVLQSVIVLRNRKQNNCFKSCLA